MSRSHSIKNLIIVRQLRRVVVLILNPHSHDNNGSKSYKSHNHSIVTRRIAVQKDTAITEEVEIASLEAIHFFREDGF